MPYKDNETRRAKYTENQESASLARARCKAYYEANKEKQKAIQKEYYKEHREACVAYSSKYSKEHRIEARENTNRYYRNARNAVLQKLGGLCAVCGWNDWRALELDHINSDGSEDRKIKRSWSYGDYKRMLDDPQLATRFQVLCCNHNRIKAHEAGEYFKDAKRVVQGMSLEGSDRSAYCDGL
jgi:hypothetical protein